MIRRSTIPPAIVAAVALGAAAVFLAMALDLRALRLVMKPVPVLALAAWVLASSRSRDGRLIAAGLLASAVGDVVLDLGIFLPGLGAFLIAHLFYIAGFVTVTRAPCWGRAIPAALYGAAVLAGLWSGLGGMAAPVAAYTAVISAMLWRAAARVGADSTARPDELAALGGAILFVLSDTVLAIKLFRAPLPWLSYLVLTLYWAGQVGIARSTAKER
jgi:uncharacterized membrane protein YhhN